VSDDVVLNINSFRRRLESMERLVVELQNRVNSEATIQANNASRSASSMNEMFKAKENLYDEISRLEMKIDDHYRHCPLNMYDRLDKLYDAVRTLNNQVFSNSENKQESKSPNELFIHIFPGKPCMFGTISMCVLRDDKCVGFEHMDCPLNMYDRLVIEKHR